MDLGAIFKDRFLHQQQTFGPDSGINAATIFRSAMVPQTWFVDPQNGAANADGRDPRKPLSTVAAALALMKAGDILYVVGNITEEVTVGPSLEDISIIGVANRPRHADHARDNTFSGSNQGCSWRQAASHGATTPLLKLRAQGVRVSNILFVPPSDAAAIYLDRNALSGTSEFDPSHLEVIGCRFAGGQSGIEDSGGCFNVHLVDCIFQDGTNGIKTLNTAVAVPLQWVVEGCHFIRNTNHIVVDASGWTIRYCTFQNGATVYIKLNQNGSSSGKNTLYQNALAGTYSNVGGYTGSASTDEWGGNWNSIAGGVTAADPA